MNFPILASRIQLRMKNPLVRRLLPKERGDKLNSFFFFSFKFKQDYTRPIVNRLTWLLLQSEFLYKTIKNKCPTSLLPQNWINLESQGRTFKILILTRQKTPHLAAGQKKTIPLKINLKQIAPKDQTERSKPIIIMPKIIACPWKISNFELPKFD